MSKRKGRATLHASLSESQHLGNPGEVVEKVGVRTRQALLKRLYLDTIFP